MNARRTRLAASVIAGFCIAATTPIDIDNLPRQGLDAILIIGAAVFIVYAIELAVSNGIKAARS
jgi:hypothetical protein